MQKQGLGRVAWEYTGLKSRVSPDILHIAQGAKEHTMYPSLFLKLGIFCVICNPLNVQSHSNE